MADALYHIIDHHEAEIAKLRQIVSDCASAIGNGAFCAPDASIEFMGHVPAEIKLVAERKDAEIARLTARVAELEEPWRPIDDEARNGKWWAIGKGPERLARGRWMDSWGRWQDAGGNVISAPTHYAPLPPAPDTKE